MAQLANPTNAFAGVASLLFKNVLIFAGSETSAQTTCFYFTELIDHSIYFEKSNAVVVLDSAA